MGRFIVVRFDRPSIYVVGRTQGTRLTLETQAVEGLSPKVFVYLRMPFGIAGFDDRFENIASPADLEEYPEDAPTPNDPRPFYRLSAANLVFRAESLLNDALAAIVEDLRELIDTLNDMDTSAFIGGYVKPAKVKVEGDLIYIGDVHAASSSSSSSSPSSSSLVSSSCSSSSS